MTDRRRVLQVLAGAAGAATAGVAVAPAGALVVGPVHTDSPLTARAGGADSGWTAVARLDDLTAGEYVQLPVVGSETDAWELSPDRKLGAVWLRRGAGDAVEAFSAVCPHLGCLINRRDDRFVCPCHDTSFDLAGRALGGPSPRSMDPIEVRVRDGSVMVRWVRYRLGVSARVQEV